MILLCFADNIIGGIFIIDDLLKDFIKDSLNLDSNVIDTISYKLIEGIAHFFIDLKKIVRECPSCKNKTRKTNGTQTVLIKHALFMDKKTHIHLKKFKYICVTCNHSFLSLPGISPANRNISHEISFQIMRLCKQPSMTFSMIAKELGISSPSAIRIFQENVPISKSKLGRVLCIDEVYLGRKSRKKYAVVIMDFETKKIIDFVYGRSVEDVNRELLKHSRATRSLVEYVSTDMYSGFFRVAKVAFPKAKICVDSFHVISLIIDMFDKLLREKLKNYDTDSLQYYLIKKQKYLLLKNETNIEWFRTYYSRKLGYYTSNQKMRDMLFDVDPDLEEVYQFKERYIKFNRKATPSKVELNALISYSLKSSIKGMKRIGETLSKNYDYILNSFIRINNRRISNGPIEATNSIIKLILRNASGYRNEDLLRKRVMYVLNNRE